MARSKRLVWSVSLFGGLRGGTSPLIAISVASSLHSTSIMLVRSLPLLQLKQGVWPIFWASIATRAGIL